MKLLLPPQLPVPSLARSRVGSGDGDGDAI